MDFLCSSLFCCMRKKIEVRSPLGEGDDSSAESLISVSQDRRRPPSIPGRDKVVTVESDRLCSIFRSLCFTLLLRRSGDVSTVVVVSTEYASDGLLFSVSIGGRSGRGKLKG